jgi:hypothetical protein
VHGHVKVCRAKYECFVSDLCIDYVGDLCLDLTQEGGSGEVRTNLLSYAELALWLGACKKIGRN